MWLKQMVIDGFKSYAQRTVISQWDRHFTAITGLNGSGKSNILDAICFVLGITNLSQVRVTNLQQLVYKEGQARVTKASVSLVFDNRDRDQSPIGYEDYEEITVTRQVVIGGRNKYMINGQTAQLNRVRDLFHSVQLDVNNPHFLIMQGRITKVLNMKPHEILGMIQEAAGTKMYELKKAQAIKTMTKKQVKVNEINTILEEEITPQLNKLRAEKKNYLKWTQNKNEIEKLDRLISVYKYIHFAQRIRGGQRRIARDSAKHAEIGAQMNFLTDSIEQLKNEIALKESQRANDDEHSPFRQLTARVNARNKQLVVYEQKRKNTAERMAAEQSEYDAYVQAMAASAATLQTKEHECKRSEDAFKEINDRYQYLVNRVASLESQQLGIDMESGANDNGDGHGSANAGRKGSLAQQLMEHKRQLSEYKSNMTSSKHFLSTNTKELKRLQQTQKQCNNNFAKFEAQCEKKERDLVALKRRLQSLLRSGRAHNNDNNGGDVHMRDDSQRNRSRSRNQSRRQSHRNSNRNNNESESERKNEGEGDGSGDEMKRDAERDEQMEATLRQQIQSKKDALYAVEEGLVQMQNAPSSGNSIARFNFEYQSPERNFKRSERVFGTIGTLFTVKDPQFTQAISTVAGGKLFNVVVDTNTTGKLLLTRGKLKQRVTIIPLNKVSSHVIHAQKIRRARELVGAEHCFPVLELIEYPAHIEPAMKFVFGNAFICTDMNSAQTVAFDRQISVKCVTLDGDVFNPAGLLTGGSNRRGPSPLESLQLYNQQTQQCRDLKGEIQTLERRFRALKQKNEQREQLSNNIEILSNEIQVLKESMNDTEYASLESQINALQLQLNDKVEMQAQLRPAIRTLQQTIFDLETDMRNYEQRKQDQMKEVKKQITECKREMKTIQKRLKKSTQQKNRMEQEIQDLKEELENSEETKHNMQTNLNDYNQTRIELEENINSCKAELKEFTQALEAERQKLIEQDKELKKLQKIVTKNEKSLSTMEIECYKLQNEIKKLQETVRVSERASNKMMEEIEWLRNESNNGNVEHLCETYQIDMDDSEEEDDENDQAEDDDDDDDDEHKDGQERPRDRAQNKRRRNGSRSPNQNNSKKNYHSLQLKRNKLMEQQSTLSNKINHKVMSMFERAESEYRDLIKKREIIRTDKKKIESVIQELDKKKEDTLERTYEKVNEHFGNIFSKLLPGTQCKLQKISSADADRGRSRSKKKKKKKKKKNHNNRMDDSKEEEDDNEEADAEEEEPVSSSILHGLEVRVAFGDVWKDSLSELSGGQRSLLALSLILSMLLFKPAPLYILDEIDAALDLSHTQNIGILIAKYFAKSQFIVVSLKEGMFANANVIFRTSFVDGVSNVQRTLGVGSNHNSSHSHSKHKENRSALNNQRRSRHRNRHR